MVIIRSSSSDARFNRVSLIAPLVAGAAIAGGASVLGGLLSFGSSNSAAKKQLQAVRETNEMNYKLAHEQRDWDLEQWQRENEYNDAESQLARWQQAGFSPQSFVGVGSPGEAAALQSPDMANQVAPPDMSGYANLSAQAIQQMTGGAVRSALDWKQLDLEQQQLDLNKKRLANETSVSTAQTSYYNALTEQAKANIKFIEEQAKFTEQQRYLSNAQLEKTWQEFEQSAKMFPHVFAKLGYETKEKMFDALFKERTFQNRVDAVAIENGWTRAQTYKTVKEGIYWAWQGKEGEFAFDTQGLRWSILRNQRDQLQFNLKFDQDTRYSSWSFDRWMRGIDAAAKVGHLIIEGAGEIRQWVHPGNWFGNTMTSYFRDDKGRITGVERSFAPFSH